VNPALFAGPKAWRLVHLLEQRAYCRLRGGEFDRAQLEFEGLLERWERDPQLAGEAWGWHLAEVARGPLREVLFARVRRLFEREQRSEAEAPRGRGLDVSMLDEVGRRDPQ